MKSLVFRYTRFRGGADGDSFGKLGNTLTSPGGILTSPGGIFSLSVRSLCLKVFGRSFGRRERRNASTAAFIWIFLC